MQGRSIAEFVLAIDSVNRLERAQYNLFADIDTHHWWFRARRQLARLVISQLKLPSSSALLDIGSGTGGMIPILTQFGSLSTYEPDQTTSDLTKLVYEKDYPDVTFLTGDGLLSHKSEFNLITAFDVLEHCEDDFATLASWLTLLKKDGYLLLTVPAFPSLWGRNDDISHHFRRYTRTTLTSVLASSKLDVSLISYTNFAAFLPVWLSRKLKEPFESRIGTEDELPWDFKLPPEPINVLLENAITAENRWLYSGAIPFGTSLVALASKNY